MMGQKKQHISNTKKAQSRYEKILGIDGKHPLQNKVPEMCVMYEARQRPGAEVAYFNFDLAKEMGLVSAKDENVLNEELKKALIETFSLVIINEWDIENNKTFPANTIKANKYMATRYLQLQHSSKAGKTSGDGRSIWNGQTKHKGISWDISSCGTGATCLSPAVAMHERNFRTGDTTISYGCGLADFDDGLMAALMSEVLYRKNFSTERTLCVLKYKDGTSINVRAGQNLIRPAHMFRYLKSGDLQNLKNLVDFYIDREQKNKRWNHEASKNSSPYDQLLDIACDDFARSAAQFEREYIFCWLDWDGDNILSSGAGILDYGSIRQFGTFHKEYRYDDVERWSTTLLEQKAKAKYIIQTFAQLVDYLKKGEKKHLKEFQSHPSLKLFDERFQKYKQYYLLKKMGMSSQESQTVLKKHPKLINHFEKLYEHIERLQTSEGTYEVEDGVSSDAVFCMRDILRELPRLYLAKKESIDTETFVEIAKSAFAKKQDLKLSSSRKRNIQSFQTAYFKIIEALSKIQKLPEDRTLLEITMRSSIINRPDFLTGNGVIHVAQFLTKDKKGARVKELMKLLPEFIQHQVTGSLPSHQSFEQNQHMRKLIQLVHEFREDI
ncbi:hypothetical protein GW916_14665 [bacterium]|nr:hypothetical protein [bacterium]